MKTEYAVLTNKGKTRKENQDSLLVLHKKNQRRRFFESGISDTNSPVCFSVFDGLGCGQCRREASILAVDILQSLKDTCSPSEAFHKINVAIDQYIQNNHLLSVGATAAAIVLEDNTGEICNIEYSGIYCFYQERIVRLFENHSLQIGTGGKQYLTQYLGISSKEMQIEPFTQIVKLCDGYRFLLCSDGLTDLVSKSEIAEIISGLSIADACKKLCE